MLVQSSVLALCALLTGAYAYPSIRADNGTNTCPTATEYACFDVINSSLCLSTNARNATVTPAQMAACVEYPNGMSDLKGAAKLCRCPGCHAKSINDVIAKLFPPPCSQY